MLVVGCVYLTFFAGLVGCFLDCLDFFGFCGSWFIVCGFVVCFEASWGVCLFLGFCFVGGFYFLCGSHSAGSFGSGVGCGCVSCEYVYPGCVLLSAVY